MDKHLQRQRIARIRHGLVAGAVAASLGLAGYLGLTPATATDSGTTTTDSGTTSSFTNQYGDNSTSVTAGSGSSHATTSGS